MIKTYKSDVTALVHEAMDLLYISGAIDTKTMKKFDDICLSPMSLITGTEIRLMREKEQVSQRVFARYLNVSIDIISKWENGEKHPTGTSLKLLWLVKKYGLAAIAA